MAPDLTVYFDGQCPFCVMEIDRLKQWNRAGRLGFIDITEPGFDPASLSVTMAALQEALHSKTSDGRLLVGIDSMLAAYRLVDKGWLVWPLGVGVLRPGFAAFYRWFAKNRYRISRAMGLRIKPRCDSGHCPVEPSAWK